MSENDWRVEKVRLEGDIKLIRQEVEQLSRDVSDIKGILSKLVWIVVGGILTAVVGYALGGGFVLG